VRISLFSKIIRFIGRLVMTFSLSLNSETPGLNRALAAASKTVEISMERLASGKKINSASDDVAGFAISERMTSQIRGLSKVVQNVNDAISLLETAQASTREITGIVQRIRELTVQGLSELNSTTDKQKIQTEIETLIAEVGSIGKNSTFNERNYHRDTMYSIQTGINDGDQLHFNLNYIDPAYLGNAGGVVSSNTSGANATITVNNSSWADGNHKFAANDVIIFANVDAPNSKTGTTTYVVNVILNNADGSQTLTLNSDFSDYDKNNIISGNGPIAFAVAEVEFPSGGGFNVISSGGSKSFANLDITDSSKASTAINTLDGTLGALNSASVRFGGLQNRLQFSVSNLLFVADSTEAARANILDADFARESVRLVKNQILQQSAVAMLAQSRAQPNLILSLLRG
jgi:flagellin